MPAKLRIPGDVRVRTRFFGQFTASDLLRLGVPLLAAIVTIYPLTSVTVGTVGWLLAGGLLGVAWYAWEPYDRHLDSHVYHAVRWHLQQSAHLQEWLGDDTGSIERNGDHIITPEGEAVGVIEVQPTNLEMKTETEQRALHAIYQELLETVTYPVAVHSLQEPLDLTAYARRIQRANPDATHEQLERDYLAYLDTLAEGTLATTRHYVVLRVARDELRWLQSQLPDWEWLPVDADVDDDHATVASELDSRCQEVLDALNTADVTAERVTGRPLQRLADRYSSTPSNPGITWTDRPESSFGEYRKTVSLTEYPGVLDLGWPLSLLRTDGLVDVTQVVTPRNPATTSKKLQRLAEKLNAEIDSFLRHGYRGTNRLEGLLEDVEWMLDLLADRDARPVDYATYVTAHADDREACRQTFAQVCNRLQTMQVDYEEPVFRTDHAAQTASPFHHDALDESLLMPTGAAAAGFPFATQDTGRETGVVYGVDAGDGTPVLLGRFAWSSHSMARMGMVGSGKSYAAKLEVLRAVLAYDDLRVVVVDPKREYGHLVRTLGGTVHTLDDGGDYAFADDEYGFTDEVLGFQVPERGQQANVARLVDLVEQLYAAVSQDTRRTLVVIDEARILMNDETGRRLLNQFVLEGRDTNTAVTLITQNASHFTFCREGREILDNVPGTVFMRHDRVPEDVVDYFGLSQREKRELFQLRTGTDADYSEALLKVSGRLDTRVRVDATPAEHAIIEADGRLDGANPESRGQNFVEAGGDGQ